MAESSADGQLEALFTRLDVQMKNAQFKKSLRIIDDGMHAVIIISSSTPHASLMYVTEMAKELLMDTWVVLCSPEDQPWRPGRCSLQSDNPD
jgi:hypothetical protein